MNPSDLIALANRLPYLEYSGPAFQKVQAQFPSAVGKDVADHVIDCIARLREEKAKLRAALKISRGNVASLYASHPHVWGNWLEVIDEALAGSSDNLTAKQDNLTT